MTDPEGVVEESVSPPTHEPQAHAPGSPGNGHPVGSDVDPAAENFMDTTRRAEVIIDRVGERVGRLATIVGRDLTRVGARIREELEDIWAEAQALRRGDGIHPQD